jgi:hypothetical protein
MVDFFEKQRVLLQRTDKKHVRRSKSNDCQRETYWMRGDTFKDIIDEAVRNGRFVGDTSIRMDLPVFKTRISLTKLLRMATLLEIPVSGWTCSRCYR